MSSADDRLDYANAIRSYSVWVEVWDASMKNRLNCGYVANSNKVKCESLCEQLCKYLPMTEWEEVYACDPGKQCNFNDKNVTCQAKKMWCHEKGNYVLPMHRINGWTSILFHEKLPHQQLVIVRSPIQDQEQRDAKQQHLESAKRPHQESARLELTMANEYLV